MYIRFVVAAPHPYADAELEIYQGTRLIVWESQRRWLREEFRRAYDEAIADLAAPECVSWDGNADGRRGLCWFRADNAARVATLRHLAWIISEMGLPVAEIGSRNPRRIIYRDPDQVVALPYGRVRRAFPRRVCL